MNSALRFVTLCSCAGLACSSGSEVTAELGSDRLTLSSIQGGTDGDVQSLDEEFLALADSILGFGGIVERPSGLVLVLKDTTIAGTAVQAVNRITLRSTDNSRIWRNRSMRVVRGEYSFAELHAWRVSLESTELPHLVYLDTDEGRNTVSVGVSTLGAARSVSVIMDRLGIPKSARHIEVLNHPEPGFAALQVVGEDSLIGHVRPMIGGIRIWRQAPGGAGGSCTLGANGAKSGFLVFATNSHCTATTFGADPSGVWWEQPGQFYSIAAHETHDVSLFSGGQCPAGKVCRWSDAALVGHDDPATWGGAFIAAPSGGYPFDYFLTYQVDASIVTTSDIGKVGASTGQSWGGPAQTCQTVPLTAPQWAALGVPSNAVLLCQNSVNLTHAGGDSGSPVFSPDEVVASFKVTLRGFLWGGSPGLGWYSPLSGVRTDLGYVNWQLF